jgi:hypothetical protein
MASRNGILARLHGLHIDFDRASDGQAVITCAARQVSCVGTRKCLAQHCGRREHLNDDLHVVTLSKELITAPPVDLWPNVIRRVTVPADVEALLLTESRASSIVR